MTASMLAFLVQGSYANNLLNVKRLLEQSVPKSDVNIEEKLIYKDFNAKCNILLIYKITLDPVF